MRPARAPAVVTFAVLLGTLFALTASAAVPQRAQRLLARPDAWPGGSVVGIGQVRTDASPLESAADILALYYDAADDLTFRVSLVAPFGIHDRVDHFGAGRVRAFLLLDEGTGRNADLPAPLRGAAPFAWDRMVAFEPDEASPARLSRSPREAGEPLEPGRVAFHLEQGWMAASLPRGAAAPRRAAVITFARGRELDRMVTTLGDRQADAYEANVAFMHFGNQGLGYSDVFHGRSGAESSSGFDEILRVHQDKNVPVNVHLSGLLQTAAEWDARNGDPVDFNAWMRAGVTARLAGRRLLGLRPAHPAVPAGRDERLGGRTGRWRWTPGATATRRTSPGCRSASWLTPGQYPGNGVIDWIGSRLAGARHRRRHPRRLAALPGPRQPPDPHHLRLGPAPHPARRRLHRQACIGGDGAGALAILSGLAGSGLGTYRLVTYADDWEMAAAMGNWATDFPNAYGTYQWMIDKCATESAWLHTWKLDAALGNANFNGDTFTPANGTYGEIGGADGYGGSNNGWYSALGRLGPLLHRRQRQRRLRRHGRQLQELRHAVERRLRRAAGRARQQHPRGRLVRADDQPARDRLARLPGRAASRAGSASTRRTSRTRSSTPRPRTGPAAQYADHHRRLLRRHRQRRHRRAGDVQRPRVRGLRVHRRPRLPWVFAQGRRLRLLGGRRRQRLLVRHRGRLQRRQPRRRALATSAPTTRTTSTP